MANDITHVLDRYYVAKKLKDRDTQLAIADELVDEWIPELLQNHDTKQSDH